MAFWSGKAMIAAFPCTGCGLCCQKVNMAEQTKSLDRGDGICRHYQQDSHQCSIYDTRPDICRVDVQFKNNYSSIMPWEEFVNINIDACRFLQKQDGFIS